MRTPSILLLTFLGFAQCRLLAAQTSRTPLDGARDSIRRGTRQLDLKAACTHHAGTCGGSYSTSFACFSDALHVFGDFYDISLTAGQTLTVTASSSDIAAAIFDPSGNTVATSNAGTVATTSYTATAAGVYTVFVFSDVETGYTLTLVCAASTGGSGSCTPSSNTLCLNSGRFSVTTSWQSSTGSGTGTAIPLTDDTGYFWFFSADNVEMITKVLNGCSINSNYWVFAGGLTDVDVMWTVTDTQTNTVKHYSNPANTAFQPIQDTMAFATCP